jgi:hypothetical protein
MKKILNQHTLAALALATFLAGSAVPAFADTNLNAHIGIGGSANASITTNLVGKITAIVQTALERADREIARRIDALTSLRARVNAMARISANDKSSLSSTIDAQINAMTALRSEIANDASSTNATSSLKTDIQSITKSYRIYALVLPQGSIEAAADRVLNVATMLTTLTTELQTRITAAQSAGHDMSTSVSAIADMNAKIADAKLQANAAVSAIANLKPDNGDQTIKTSNTAVLKDARAKVRAGQQDLVAARKDAGTIVKALLSVSVSASASSTTNVQ